MSTVETVHRLVLLRHAKAEPEGAVGDELRALAVRGRAQAGAVGEGLVAADLEPEVVLCSSAVRTRQTWDLVRQQLPAAEPEVDVTDRLYAARPADVLDLVRGVDDRVRTVLVVGHEPTMSTTAGVLAGPESDQDAVARVRFGVPTATFMVLQSRRPWSQWDRGAATLTQVVQPSG